jgi:hypothetical protein
MFTVYLICAEYEDTNLYKIGYTRRTIEERIKELKTGNGSNIYIVDSFKSKWGTKIEANLHRRYFGKKVDGEWFLLDKLDLTDFKFACKQCHDNLELISENNTWYKQKGKFY